MSKINRHHLVESVSESLGVSRSKADKMVNCVLDTIIGNLSAGSNVELRGLGSFTVKQFDEFKSRNPQTGEMVTVPPKRRVKFKMSDSIHRSLNG